MSIAIGSPCMSGAFNRHDEFTSNVHVYSNSVNSAKRGVQVKDIMKGQFTIETIEGVACTDAFYVFKGRVLDLDSHIIPDDLCSVISSMRNTFYPK